MIPTGQDSLRTRSTLEVDGKSYAYFSLEKAAGALGDLSRLPFSMKVFLENLVRHEDNAAGKKADIEAVAGFNGRPDDREVSFMPARVIWASPNSRISPERRLSAAISPACPLRRPDRGAMSCGWRPRRARRRAPKARGRI